MTDTIIKPFANKQSLHLSEFLNTRTIRKVIRLAAQIQKNKTREIWRSRPHNFERISPGRKISGRGHSRRISKAKTNELGGVETAVKYGRQAVMDQVGLEVRGCLIGPNGFGYNPYDEKTHAEAINAMITEAVSYNLNMVASASAPSTRTSTLHQSLELRHRDPSRRIIAAAAGRKVFRAHLLHC